MTLGVNPTHRRQLWFFIFTLLTLLTLRDIVDLVKEYRSRPVDVATTLRLIIFHLYKQNSLKRFTLINIFLCSAMKMQLTSPL